MNILELTGMKSTKYGGVESYFAELVKICRVDKFILQQKNHKLMSLSILHKLTDSTFF